MTALLQEIENDISDGKVTREDYEKYRVSL